MKQFFIKSTVLTFFILALGAILYFSVLKKYYIPVLPILVIFFYSVTNLVHAYLLKIAEKSGSKFTSKYMATSFIKMFFLLAIGIAYLFFDRENSRSFMANFLLLYVVYSIFEVYEFLKVVKQVK